MNFLATLLQTIAFVPTVVNGIEHLFSHRSGPEKKDAALSFLEAALFMNSAVANLQIIDRAKFKSGLEQLIDGTVACLNASVWAKVKPGPQSTGVFIEKMADCATQPPQSSSPESSLQKP